MRRSLIAVSPASTSQIAKVAQNVAIRLTVVFQVVGIEICFVGSFEFKVEITCYENFRRLRFEL